jgi:hypothetical protein
MTYAITASAASHAFPRLHVFGVRRRIPFLLTGDEAGGIKLWTGLTSTLGPSVLSAQRGVPDVWPRAVELEGILGRHTQVGGIGAAAKRSADCTISALCISKDHKWAVSASMNGQFRIWDLEQLGDLSETPEQKQRAILGLTGGNGAHNAAPGPLHAVRWDGMSDIVSVQFLEGEAAAASIAAAVGTLHVRNGSPSPPHFGCLLYAVHSGALLGRVCSEPLLPAMRFLSCGAGIAAIGVVEQRPQPRGLVWLPTAQLTAYARNAADGKDAAVTRLPLQLGLALDGGTTVTGLSSPGRGTATTFVNQARPRSHSPRRVPTVMPSARTQLHQPKHAPEAPDFERYLGEVGVGGTATPAEIMDAFAAWLAQHKSFLVAQTRPLPPLPLKTS